MPEDPTFDDALAMMRDLRARCDWDRAQTHDSLRPYLLEEAHELDETIRDGDAAHMREELGDLSWGDVGGAPEGYINPTPCIGAQHRRASDNAVRHPALCASVPPDPTALGNASIRSNQLLPPAFGHLAAGRARVVAVNRADEYRRRAQQCLEMARTFGDRDARVTLAHMAEVWLRLVERNVPKQTQPAFQQQQQIQPKDDGKE